MEKKKEKGKSVKLDNETYYKLVGLKAKTHIPMATIIRLSVEKFEKEREVK